jgi:hypothetical protein
MLRSAPVAKENLVLAQSSNRRVAPAIIAATLNAIVSGSKSSEGLVSPNSKIKGWAAGISKIFSGAVKTPRNGNTAPILNISAVDVKSIKNNSIQN